MVFGSWRAGVLSHLFLEREVDKAQASLISFQLVVDAIPAGPDAPPTAGRYQIDFCSFVVCSSYGGECAVIDLCQVPHLFPRQVTNPGMGS